MALSPSFNDADLAQFARLGVTARQVEEQLGRLRHPPASIELVRPCRRGDGIHRLNVSQHPEILARWEAVARAGRLSKFVPASGAATRMFGALRWWRERPELTEPEALLRVAVAEPMAAQALAALEAWGRLPFGPLEPFLDELARGDLPKALVPFHRTVEGVSTAFEEHLVEGAAYLAAGERRTCRLHFSVAPEQLPRFTAAYESCRGRLESRLGVRYEVGFSTQDRATDTLAVDADRLPLRGADGSLVFQPSGHGALLANLGSFGGDLVLIKNIDNVVPEGRQAPVVHWQRLLIGTLAALEERVAARRSRLAPAGVARDSDIADAVALLAAEFGAEPPPALGQQGTRLADWARERLARPLRVCGMVPAGGNVGGGPFWVRDASGETTPQIVEGAQIARDDPAQRRIWQSASHFNPVDLVCALLDAQGKPHDLERYVDPATGFVADKTWQGSPIKTLERPGLWNGAMAGWNTYFVEIPAATFAPVKTVLDLLRPEHQAAPAT